MMQFIPVLDSQFFFNSCDAAALALSEPDADPIPSATL
jgi:hypothetical protein